MYSFYAYYEWYVEHVKQELNHMNLFMKESSSLFKKIQICFSDKKWSYFGLEKIRYVFKNLKNIIFGDKNSDLCLLHKTKSFDLKNIKSVFKNLEKWPLIYKRSDLFLRPKKKWFFYDRKTKYVFICLKNIKNIFLKREFHS